MFPWAGSQNLICLQFLSELLTLCLCLPGKCTFCCAETGGEEFTLPVEADYQSENDRLSALVAEHKKLGHEIVVVMGVGFVGASRVLVLGTSYREDVGDTQIKTFFAAGYEVKGLGRGHMKRLKEEVAGK